MIGAAPQGLDLTQVIVASITGASLVAAAAVTAFLTFGRRNAREGARQGAKEGARQGALENHAETMDALDTGNLMKIGAYVHDMAGTVELLQAQSHDFGRRQDEMHGAILEAREYAAQTRERLTRVHEEVIETRVESRRAMRDHIEEIGPLRAFVERLIGEPKEKGEGT